MKQVMYTLTCADEAEARNISRMLLDAKCAACVKRLNVSSSYWWHDAIENADEVLLLIESTDEAYNSIVRILDEHHSYDEYVLNQVAVSKSNQGVFEWVTKYSHGNR